MPLEELDLDNLNLDEISNHNSFERKDNNPLAIRELLIEMVTPDPNQPRKFFEEEKLQELSDSIKIHGLLEPIVVIENEKGTYTILAGERRYRAHLLANLKTIKALVTVSGDDNLEKQLIENTQRENLSIFEEAIGYKILWDSKKYDTKSALAKRVSKKEIRISKLFSVLTLDKEVLNHLAENNPKIGLEVLSELAKIKDIKTQKEFYYDYVAGKITRQDIRNGKKGVAVGADGIILHQGQTTIKDLLGEDEENEEESSPVKSNKPTQKKKNNILLAQDGYLLASGKDDDKIYLTHEFNPSIQIIANQDFINEYSKNFKANKIYKITIEEVGEIDDFL